jgi:hypothetical protein
MKAQHFEHNDEPLSRVLREWKVTKPLPPRFQDEVWRRIERSETSASPWWMLIYRFAAAISRPSLAASYLTVLLLAGVIAGYWQARVANAHAEATLSARYVQMLDPYHNSLH